MSVICLPVYGITITRKEGASTITSDLPAMCGQDRGSVLESFILALFTSEAVKSNPALYEAIETAVDALGNHDQVMEVSLPIYEDRDDAFNQLDETEVLLTQGQVGDLVDAAAKVVMASRNGWTLDEYGIEDLEDTLVSMSCLEARP